MSDTVKFQHHAIAIPELTPADRILEALRNLEHAIKQQPAQAPMEELQAIEMLREVLLGERKERLPKDSVQLERAKQKAMPAQVPIQTASPEAEDDDLPEMELNYVSDDEEDEPALPLTKEKAIKDPTSVADFWEIEEPPPEPQVRRSKRVLQ